MSRFMTVSVIGFICTTGETEDRLLCAGGAEAMKPDSNTLQNPDIPLQQSTCKTNQASAPDSLMSPITSFGKNVQETSD